MQHREAFHLAVNGAALNSSTLSPASFQDDDRAVMPCTPSDGHCGPSSSRKEPTDGRRRRSASRI